MQTEVVKIWSWWLAPTCQSQSLSDFSTALFCCISPKFNLEVNTDWTLTYSVLPHFLSCYCKEFMLYVYLMQLAGSYVSHQKLLPVSFYLCVFMPCLSFQVCLILHVAAASLPPSYPNFFCSQRRKSFINSYTPSSSITQKLIHRSTHWFCSDSLNYQPRITPFLLY